MKIGIFGGAFNPIHNGHIHLMKSYEAALSLDKIILIPTAVPPHKTREHFAPEEDRLNMLLLISQGDSRLEVSDVEYRRKGKSYTYLTLLELRELYPEDEFFLLIGSDQYLNFHTWRKPNAILSMATVCTMARDDGEYEKLIEYRSENEIMKNSIVSDFKPVEVSSTEIRERIKRGRSIKRLVPEAVEKYIKEHGLYV